MIKQIKSPVWSLPVHIRVSYLVQFSSLHVVYVCILWNIPDQTKPNQTKHISYTNKDTYKYIPVRV